MAGTKKPTISVSRKPELHEYSVTRTYTVTEVYMVKAKSPGEADEISDTMDSDRASTRWELVQVDVFDFTTRTATRTHGE